MPTLLIAHPDETLRSEMRAALATMGHEVIEATTGEQAIKRTIETDAQFVLVSSHLPDQQGADVCKLLRGSPGGKELGILIAGPEFWEAGVGGAVVAALGVDGFVALPCRRSSLASAIEGVVDRFRRTTPLPEGGLTDAIEAAYAKLDFQSYYELLSVRHDATLDVIRDAFHRVSLLYHPDRHLSLRGSSVYERVNSIYKRITEAWKVLSSADSRARYDQGVGAGVLRLADTRPSAAAGDADPEAGLDDPNARKYYRLGKASEDSRDFRAARMNYAFAQTYAPDHAGLQAAVARMEFALGLREDDPTAKPPTPNPPAAPEPQAGAPKALVTPDPSLPSDGGAALRPDLPADLPERLPAHLAIIMDGNGRWAQARGLQRVDGHRQGAESVRTITRACRRWGIRHLTLYAFSEQNWERPEDEVAALMELLADYVRDERDEIMDNGIRLDAVGALDKLPAPALQGLNALRDESRANKGMTLCLALSYGGREEIVDAARRACELAKMGELDPDSLDVESFRGFLSRPDIPDPDLVIRTSGEFRVSNFLLWQIAYAEFHITDTLWPEFGQEHLLEALKAYASRERRFGKTGEQIRG